MSEIIQHDWSCTASIKLLPVSIREWRSPLCPAYLVSCSPTTCPHTAPPASLWLSPDCCGWSSNADNTALISLTIKRTLINHQPQRWPGLMWGMWVFKSQCWYQYLQFCGIIYSAVAINWCFWRMKFLSGYKKLLDHKISPLNCSLISMIVGSAALEGITNVLGP